MEKHHEDLFDEHGKRVGVRVGLTMMDAAESKSAGAGVIARTEALAGPGACSRPGIRPYSPDQVAARALARDEAARDIREAWRKQGSVTGTAPKQCTAADRAAAYDNYEERLSNAWRRTV